MARDLEGRKHRGQSKPRDRNSAQQRIARGDKGQEQAANRELNMSSNDRGDDLPDGSERDPNCCSRVAHHRHLAVLVGMDRNVRESYRIVRPASADGDDRFLPGGWNIT
jgi:hypothetical protein